MGICRNWSISLLQPFGHWVSVCPKSLWHSLQYRWLSLWKSLMWLAKKVFSLWTLVVGVDSGRCTNTSSISSSNPCLERPCLRSYWYKRMWLSSMLRSAPLYNGTSKSSRSRLLLFVGCCEMSGDEPDAVSSELVESEVSLLASIAGGIFTACIYVAFSFFIVWKSRVRLRRLRRQLGHVNNKWSRDYYSHVFGACVRRSLTWQAKGKQRNSKQTIYMVSIPISLVLWNDQSGGNAELSNML